MSGYARNTKPRKITATRAALTDLQATRNFVLAMKILLQNDDKPPRRDCQVAAAASSHAARRPVPEKPFRRRDRGSPLCRADCAQRRHPSRGLRSVALV